MMVLVVVVIVVGPPENHKTDDRDSRALHGGTRRCMAISWYSWEKEGH